jgi:hypothetical protein
MLAKAKSARNRLLTDWAGYVTKAAAQGALGSRPIQITRIRAIPGPRAGALEISAGLDTGRLLRALSRNDSADLRQFVPWRFAGEPAAYMSGRDLRLEAGWPDGLAETLIRLDQLGQHPKAGGRWIAGRNERGHTVVAGLTDRTPHYLIAGTTGSGKSVALHNATIQLSDDPTNQLVLLDGKYGESLQDIAHLRGVLGPVAVEAYQMRAALAWTCLEMRRRYQTGDKSHRTIVVFDEFQEFADDAIIVDLMRRIAAQGRGANIHLLAATQHPDLQAFGDKTTRRNLTGRLALLVNDPDASRVAVGSSKPRADHLLGAGDAYAVSPGAIHRIQGAYIDQREIDQAPTGQWRHDRWPDYDAEDLGHQLPTVNWAYDGTELGHSIISAYNDEGRPTLTNRLENAGLSRPGAERGIRLLQLGRDAYGTITASGYQLTMEAA